MSSKIDTQKHQSARKLGNIFLSWKIHHFSLTSAKPNCRIVSPIFRARGPQTTTWKLILLPYMEVHAKRHFVFRLHRLDTESPATVVSTDWKIALMTINESCLCARRGHALFDGKSTYESTVCDDAASIIDGLDPFESDTLLLYFQLIVSHREANNSIEPTSDAGLKSLSRDLLGLYKRGMYSDVVIRIRDKRIRAHKAILQCRSPFFKNFIEKYRNRDVLDLKELNYKIVNDMLSYLYSGKLEFVLGKPSISMYECAVRFQIEEVMRYYALDHFPLESQIDVKEVYFVWNISNFEAKVKHRIEMEFFTEVVSNVTVRLCLYPKVEDGRCNFVSIFAQFEYTDKKQRMVCLELGLLDCNKKIAYASKGFGVGENTVILEFCDWSYVVINSNVFSSGSLGITVKLQIADAEECWKNFGAPCLYPFSNPNETEHSYNRLSSDIKSLLTSGLCSDITFVSECMDFKVHKCILAARSHTLNKQIAEWSPVYLTCNAMSVKSHIISILMDYLYSGILNNYNISDISEMNDVADEYLLTTLKVIISGILAKSLTVENVSDILIFAEAKRDTELKLSALKFISLNSPAVFAQKNFQQLKASHVFLFTEIHEFARNEYYAFMSSKIPQT